MPDGPTIPRGYIGLGPPQWLVDALSGPGIADQLQAAHSRFQDVARQHGPGAALRDPLASMLAANVAGQFDFTGPSGGLAGVLLDPRQLARPRGKIEATYPAWGSSDFVPGQTPRDVTIFKNPSPEEVARLTKRGDLRVVMSKDGKEAYVWPFDEALHEEVGADVFPGSRVRDRATGIYTNTYDQGLIPGNPSPR